MVGIWERVWADHKTDRSVLQYHILGAPHHCSWRSLSSESWSESNGKAEVSPDARKALGQALAGAIVVASSKPVVDDDDDPPCIGAKRVYETILTPVDGNFVNTAAHKAKAGAVPMEFDVRSSGPVLQEAGSELGIKAASGIGLSVVSLREAAEQIPAVNKGGERRFA